MGLLFTIARTLFELGLSVSVAKIGTYLDQVVDVFYVTDQQGRKILDEQRLQEISSRLLGAIDLVTAE
jgi:[protein-PII] uridylyltransferase